MKGTYNRIRKEDIEILGNNQDIGDIVDELLMDAEFLTAKETKQIKRLVQEIGYMIKHYHGYRYIGEERGYFVRYIDGVYANDVYQNLSYIIGEYFKQFDIYPTESNIREVRNWVERNAKIEDDFEQNHDYVNFRNGLLKVRSDYSDDPCWVMYPHTPDFHTMIQIPHEYKHIGLTGDPAKDCPEFHEYLTKVSDGNQEMYDTLWEIYGYCMQLSVRFKKAFLIVSEESNTGKSTYINILTGILGEENCSKVRLDKITSKGFGAAPAANKLINYYDDLPRYIPVENIDIWKSQIDGFYFDFEKKYHDATKRRNILKQIYAANKLPKMAWDLTTTVRLVILFFKHVFIPKSEGGDQIKFWEEKHILNNQKEIDGIIYNSMRALKRLFERDEFLGMSAEEVLEIALKETDVVYRFVKECCVTGYCKVPEQRTGTIEDWFHQETWELYDLFTHYRELVGDNSKITRVIFTKILKNMGFEVKKVAYYEDQNGKRTRKYKNVYLGLEFMCFPDYITKLIEEIE